MQELFVRTLSQGLQAFMPIAAYLAYARGIRRTGMISPARWAMGAAALLTVPAGYAFQHTTHQAGFEALLATATAGITIGFWRSLRSDGARVPLIAAAAALTLVVVRQTMEIEVVLQASLVELRSFEATVAAGGAVICAACLAFAWTQIARRFSMNAVHHATIAFVVVFLIQALIYALHESAEARVLPWSDVLHEASEPYGPEGAYGRGISFLLFALPLLKAQELPEGPGKRLVQDICAGCHGLDSVTSQRATRQGWESTVDYMIQRGASMKDEDARVIVDYLTKNFGVKVNVNKATSIELESGLTLRRSQAAAVIEYRTKNGTFKSLDDLILA